MRDVVIEILAAQKRRPFIMLSDLGHLQKLNNILRIYRRENLLSFRFLTARL